MLLYLWLGLGGALGTIARYWLDGAVSDRYGREFPWGILAINIIGSAVIGLLFAITGQNGRWPSGDNLRGFLMVGICGGFTTFSSFSLHTLNLFREGKLFYAGANVVLSVALCLLAVWTGFALGASLNPKVGT